MNIKELTEDEINRLMLWLYPERASDYREEVDYDYYKNIKQHNAEYYHESKVYEVADLHFDFLEDYNLTIPLVIEIGMYVDFSKLNNTNPLRDMCEVLIHSKIGSKCQ